MKSNMTDALLLALQIAAALGCGLMAGVFFAFSAFVMNALARLEPVAGIAAMQSINRAVLNPLFMVGFFGTGAICVLVMLASLWRWQEPGAGFLLAGGAIYLVGGILVTIAFNVPLNEALAAIAPADRASATRWTRYLARWTSWNHIRTVACLVAAALLTVAVYLQARGPDPV